MAEEKKQPRKITTTPAGVAVYPHFVKPDTKWKPEGEYHTKLCLAGSEQGPMMEVIAEALAEAKNEAEKQAKPKNKKPKEADMPFESEFDDNGDETGNMLFKFKSKASGKRKDGSAWARKLPIYDAKGKVMKEPPAIYGGSTVAVAFTAVPWVNPKFEYGVKLQLEAVQVINLVTSGGMRSASSFGFGAREDGYHHEEEDAPDSLKDAFEEEEADADGEEDF